MTTTFIGYRRGAAVFRLRCECGTRGELAVPEHDRNRLVPCPGGCGTYFIRRCGKGFFATPTLEVAICPAKRKAPESTAGEPQRGRTECSATR